LGLSHLNRFFRVLILMGWFLLSKLEIFMSDSVS